MERARAIATRTVTVSKQLGMNYVSKITVNTAPSNVYEKQRRMRGRVPRCITY